MVVYEAPTTPPDAWGAEEFYAWFQHARQTDRQHPQLAERRRPRNLSAWWSSCLMTPGVDVHVLREAVGRFAADPKWRSTDPPWPFAAFASQWSNYARPRRAAG
ncbi:MAG: hypothetical protein SFW67_35635 [Myxococcaceae bacterium]|nr:hypothetical protein [Myxococcaceae bacterium]